MVAHSDFSSFTQVRDWARAHAVPIARLAELLGISQRDFYNLRARKIFPQDVQDRLQAKKKQLTALAKEMLQKRQEKETRQQESAARTLRRESISPDILREVLTMWGTSQVETACVAGVSYDTVTSWCNGRRRIFRLEHLDLIDRLRKIAKKRRFSAVDTVFFAGHFPLMRFIQSKKKQVLGFSKEPTGTFPIVALETSRGKFRLGKETDSICLRRAKDGFTLSLSWDKHTIRLTAEKRILRREGEDAISYFLSDKDGNYLGSLAFRERFGSILLISAEAPIRFVFSA